tara:strand:+ start:440 stop:676 length:237 start_codon:yes stop_codon:yes gene_type:complete
MEDYRQEILCIGGSLDRKWKTVDIRNYCFRWALPPNYKDLTIEDELGVSHIALEIEEYDIIKYHSPRGYIFYQGEFIE